MKSLGRRGVTLVEMLVVVAVIGILARIALPKLVSVRQKAYATQMVGATNAIRVALMSYYTEQAVWPSSGTTGSVPSGLTQYLGANAFSAQAYQIRYRAVRSGTNRIPMIIVYPTDPDTCIPVYNLLGGASNQNAFASCGGVGGSITLYVTN